MEKNKYLKEISDIIKLSKKELTIQEILDELFKNDTIKNEYYEESKNQQKDLKILLTNQINDFFKSKSFSFSNIKEESKNNIIYYSLKKAQNENELFNKILFGPPGTGKSHKIKEQTKLSNNIFRVTFFEEYSYYDFVGQYKPIVIKDYDHPILTIKNGRAEEKEPSPIISYKFVPGIFIESYICAKKNHNETIYLIIEEINRGNCSAIFGDIFQLLDRDLNGSKYPIKPSKELYDFLVSNDLIEDTISLPSNLKILATMNTSDQSLFPMDSAFKRRWQQEYCPIQYNDSNLNSIFIENTNILWVDFIKKINIKILTILNNEDKQIGQWFIEPVNGVILENDFMYKVISYLYYDVFKHYREIIFKELSFSNIITKNTEILINELFQ